MSFIFLQELNCAAYVFLLFKNGESEDHHDFNIFFDHSKSFK